MRKTGTSVRPILSGCGHQRGEERLSTWIERIYHQHRLELFRVSWLILRDQQQAEDAVHAAFVSMLRRSHQPDNPKAYALVAVRNAALDQKRRRAQASLVPLGELTSRNSTPELGCHLADELAALGEQKREVIELRLRVGLSFAEIAELLDESVPTVSSRYYRAIDELRQQYEVYDG